MPGEPGRVGISVSQVELVGLVGVEPHADPIRIFECHEPAEEAPQHRRVWHLVGFEMSCPLAKCLPVRYPIDDGIESTAALSSDRGRAGAQEGTEGPGSQG
jgi:hypothetical protein